MVLKTDIRSLDLKRLGKFDVILIDPPWEEYARRCEVSDGHNNKVNREKLESWAFEDILNLKVECLGDSPSFMFLWVGTENLERGRELFRKWGYKRCEDIVWIKSNKKEQETPPPPHITNTSSPSGFLQRVKEHCLVGYAGDVRKASDP